MKELMKLLEKKGAPVGESDKMAKMKVLAELQAVMEALLGEDMDGEAQQVTVAAPDSEGLEEGLEAAQGIVQGMPNSKSGEEDEEEMY